MEVAPRTIVLYSDIGCPWAYLAVTRLRATRARLGLDDDVGIDHRAFPLELVNERVTPWPVLTAEIPVVATVEPDAGWQVWQAAPWEWPVSTLPALEAVQAAKKTSLRASEDLDYALRHALFAESRCITMRHVVIAVARTVPDLDVDALARMLDEGRTRADVMQQWRSADGGGVAGSPHVFLPDGTDVHNPGVAMHWQGEHGTGFPVIEHDDPAVYDDLVKRAAS
jgi:predicted DsbA family dithiol-disulfide isomerase